MSEIPIPSQMLITIAEQCDRGKVREENQDSVRHMSIALGELLIVADGIGGYEGGATASRMVVEGMVAYLGSLSADYPPDRAIREASGSANASVYEAANAPDSPYRRMGSTVVLAILQTNATGGQAQGQAQTQAWIGHIGDSRAYLARDGQLSRITSDHSAVQALLNRNLITPEQALHHPDASVLTRSIGHRAEVEIDIDTVTLIAGDGLLLCSDGLWGYVAEQEIAAVAVNPDLSPEDASRQLLELALTAGGHDNIGIVLARLSLRPVAAPADSGKRRRYGVMEILAICLLVFAGAGAVVYFGLSHYWLNLLHRLHWNLFG